MIFFLFHEIVICLQVLLVLLVYHLNQARILVSDLDEVLK